MWNRIIRLCAVSTEGAMFAAEINKFVEQVRALGPLNWSQPGEPVSTPIMEEVSA
jgi:hypothetical protein